MSHAPTCCIERSARRSVPKHATRASATAPKLSMLENGVRVPLDMPRVEAIVRAACEGLADYVTPDAVLSETVKNLYDGVPLDEVYKSAILAARALIEKDPAYSAVTARLLLHTVRREVLGEEVTQPEMQARYAEVFPRLIKHGIGAGLLDERLGQFDLKRLGAALDARRDLNFNYLGLQTLYDRYFLHHDGRRFELPQVFFMRVAMGLALNEIEREARAIEFYEVLSSFDFMSSTPTLFNAGTRHSQLSSCYLSTVGDDLDGIYEAIKENALLAKYAGGLGNDWTPVRALGSHIKGTNGKSQGVVPFLKVVNDTAVAVNQGGKRKGAVCCYLETWHLDIEEFLELRKNTGDDRRRTHDMNTANWIPDLFMKRVFEGGEWTLFSPSDCPDLHDRTGRSFEEAYVRYEEKAARGELKLFKKVSAQALWRKMLSMLFETGHPWITFKDACNLRSPQQHVGTIHSSNLCTEITLNTSDTEIAVCNLGSVNLPAHMKAVEGGYELDHQKLKKTIRTAMRMLDNVIDINYYAVNKARNSNVKHRPVGLGIMGFQNCLHMMRVPYASNEAVEFADRSMEATCYYAYWASTELAAGARPVLVIRRLAVGPRHLAAGLAAAAEGTAGQLKGDGAPFIGRCRRQFVDGLERLARPYQATRHAQFELRRDCAHCDDLEHRRCRRLYRADVSEPVRQVQPVGRIHRRQRVPGARSESAGRVGRSDGARTEVLRRLARQKRAGARRSAQAVRHCLRNRSDLADRMRGAAPEVDRPGAVPQYIYGGRFGQEARRDLQTGVAARAENHVLPPHHRRDARGEVDHEYRTAKRGSHGCAGRTVRSWTARCAC